MNTLYLDCFAGISGDMSIGALLDLGVDKEKFLSEIEKIGISDEFEIKISKVSKCGILATDFDVILKDNHHHHGHEHSHGRNYSDIIDLIHESELKDNVKEMAKAIFYEIGVAEAKVHGKTIEEVHFHEVGAVDSIVDIIGFAICIDLLEIDEIYASEISIGTGYVKCDHGIMPVPAPATLEILQGVPLRQSGTRGEMVTPTGAGILKAMVKEFKTMDIVPEKIGYGAGKKDFEHANVLRGVLCKKKKENYLF